MHSPINIQWMGCMSFAVNDLSFDNADPSIDTKFSGTTILDVSFMLSSRSSVSLTSFSVSCGNPYIKVHAGNQLLSFNSPSDCSTMFGHSLGVDGRAFPFIYRFSSFGLPVSIPVWVPIISWFGSSMQISVISCIKSGLW